MTPDPLPPHLRALVGYPRSQGDADWLLTFEDRRGVPEFDERVIMWLDRFRTPATMALIFPGYP